MTTVKQLKRLLAALGPEADNMEVRIWLPGSQIYLSAPDGSAPTPFEMDGRVMLEGNLAEGSVLR